MPLEPTQPCPAASWRGTASARPLLAWPLIVTLGALAPLGGCEREMLDPVCTPVAAGQLVVTELRGAQAGVDTYGQWIELYNPTGASVSLAGIRFRITKLDGSAETGFTVRNESLTIGPTGYVVLGRFPREEPPAHVDYGYLEESDANLPADGVVELYVCNELVDAVIYRGLPDTGTLALDGALTPTAAANDDEANWCNDDADVGGDPTQVGIPGTPGEPNRTCN